MEKKFYGLISRRQALETAKAVNDVISPKTGNRGVLMILETCAAETHLGQFEDKSDYKHGTSLAQVDFGTFEWLQDSYKDRALNDAIKDVFDIDLGAVQYRELEHNPLLAMIWCRLRYLIVPDPIPEDLTGRAKLWKKVYNSTAGKGTVEGYIEKVKQCKIADLVTL